MSDKKDDSVKVVGDFSYNFSAYNEYAKYLQELYPFWYKEGIKLAVKEYGCYENSLSARMYAIGYCEGRISVMLHKEDVLKKD